MSARVAVGLGCRRGVRAAPVAALVRETLAQAGIPLHDAALFTIDAKRPEEGLARAAGELGLSLSYLSREELAGVETLAQSDFAKTLFGVSSVAEAAALAGAGEGAVLLVPRIVRENVTCAVACAMTCSS